LSIFKKTVTNGGIREQSFFGNKKGGHRPPLKRI